MKKFLSLLESFDKEGIRNEFTVLVPSEKIFEWSKFTSSETEQNQVEVVEVLKVLYPFLVKHLDCELEDNQDLCDGFRKVIDSVLKDETISDMDKVESTMGLVEACYILRGTA